MLVVFPLLCYYCNREERLVALPSSLRFGNLGANSRDGWPVLRGCRVQMMTDVPFWPALPSWPALIFWSAIVVGLVASSLGLVWRRASLLVGGAILMLPASLYLTATPRFQYVGFVPVACLLMAAYAVQRDRVWIGGLLVAAGVVFWSVMASMLSFPILLHVLVAGAAIGIVAARHLSWKVAVYLPVGVVGALVGALLSFGDAPFLMRRPYLNLWTLSVLGAIFLVTVLGVVDENVFRRSRHAHD